MESWRHRFFQKLAYSRTDQRFQTTELVVSIPKPLDIF